MALFVIIGRDGPDGAERRKRCREQHLAQLEALNREGRIAYAGPIRNEADDGSIGSVIVMRATSLQEARSVVDQDPYVIGGVFQSITVNPFKQVFPAES